MKTFSATTRITSCMVCLVVSVWILAFMLGMFPDRHSAVVKGRVSLCENLALHCSLLAGRNDRQIIQALLDSLVQRNHDIESAAIRRHDGDLLFSVGPHAKCWDLVLGDQSTATQMGVPILSGKALWGTVELRFHEPTNTTSWLASHPLITCGLFSAAATYLLLFIYLRKVLKHLDLSSVIPQQVRQTLDIMADGLLLLDLQHRILLANNAFADKLGISPDDLTGRQAGELPFEAEGQRPALDDLPWVRAMRDETPQTGDMLTLRGKHNQSCVMKVSATPIYGDDGKQRGTLASFADMTVVERSRVELRQLLDALKHSRDEIQRQNHELARLAASDPRSSRLNRRAFIGDLESPWSSASLHDYLIE